MQLPTAFREPSSRPRPIDTSRATQRRRTFASSAAVKPKPKSLERDVLVSVLEASATRRDAKGYLQKYAPGKRQPLDKVPAVPDPSQHNAKSGNTPNVAIASLRLSEPIDDTARLGLARTLSQLRLLGLPSVVILDCGSDVSHRLLQDCLFQLCEDIDTFGTPGAKVIRDVFQAHTSKNALPESALLDRMRVEDHGAIQQALGRGLIPLIPSAVRHDDISLPQPVDLGRSVLAMTRYLSGKQFDLEPVETHEAASGEPDRPSEIASIERIIVMDASGGIPFLGRPGASHRFVNLEQEYETLMGQLEGGKTREEPHEDGSNQSPDSRHAANLSLAYHSLRMLPPSASALITTPHAAANIPLGADPSAVGNDIGSQNLDFGNMVTTRRKLNPLLHNLLTDKPVYSSSLPVQRVQQSSPDGGRIQPSIAATLVKRGMPLTIFPDPRSGSWTPPKPGAPRLRLTDTCIDLPRLVYLIEDSFHRKLDVDDYLARVNESLAGIIIAGEYEGGAILTWECPPGLTKEEAYESGRLVPYLDKFAVLKSRQGSGGVADIVFNSMVKNCFPDGVCWRSRRNNPVNKWYFERSLGTSKLTDSPWSMFWTTPSLTGQHPTLGDYEAVCRGVEPSWADNRHILD